MQVIVGTPDTVIPKIKTIMSVLRIGIFIILSIQGPVADDDRRTSMRLFAQEVIPATEGARKGDRPSRSVRAHARKREAGAGHQARPGRGS